MDRRSPWRLHLVAALAAGALAAPSLAQTVRDKILEENPSRTPGGSCMYDGQGKLMFQPRRGGCPPTDDAPPPASLAEDAKPAPAAAPLPVAQAPNGPALPSRQRVAAQLAERERMDVELARVREAAGYEDREAARRVTEEALAKLSRHLENEARLLQPLAGPER